MAICKDPAGQSSAPMSTSRRNNVMDHNTQPGDILWTPRPCNQRDQEPRTKVGYGKKLCIVQKKKEEDIILFVLPAGRTIPSLSEESFLVALKFYN